VATTARPATRGLQAALQVEAITLAEQADGVLLAQVAPCRFGHQAAHQAQRIDARGHAPGDENLAHDVGEIGRITPCGWEDGLAAAATPIVYQPLCI